MSPSTTLDGREERGEITRQKVISAARRAFARDGFTKASVRSIATEAGVHAALLRYHFGSKDALWERVVTEAMDALRDRLLADLSGAADLRDLAHAAVDSLLDHLDSDPDFPRLILRGALRRDPVIASIAERHLRPVWLVASAQSDTDADLLRERVLTVYGAAVAPFLYQTLLTPVFGSDPLADAPRARRRGHLHRLVDLMLEER